MADQSPGWWEAFDDEALEYLDRQASGRLDEAVQVREHQIRSAVYLVGWAITIVGASGIFGDLRIDQIDAVSVLSGLAAAAASALGIAAAWMFRPRRWADGADVEWLSQFAGASTRQLRGRVLNANIVSWRMNAAANQERGRALFAVYVLTVLTSLLIVAVELAAAVTARGS